MLFDLIAKWQDSGPISVAYWGPDLRVAFFAFLISAAAGTGFGLMPALAVTRPDLTNVLKAGMQAGSQAGVGLLHRRFGLRNLFVVYQVAAAMALVLIMGSAVVSVLEGTNRDPGLDPGPLTLFTLDPLRDGFTLDQSAVMFAGLRENLTRLAGVDSVTFSDQPPLTDTLPDTSVSVPTADIARPTAGRQALHKVVVHSVGPGFFATLGVPIVRGAEFGDRDFRKSAEPTAILPVIINQAASKDLFGSVEPLGRLIRQDERLFQVIGLVRYDRPMVLMNQPVATVFVPLTIKDLDRGSPQGTTIVIHARRPLDETVIRRALQAVDSRLSMFNEQTMRHFLREQDHLGQLVWATYFPIGMFGLILGLPRVCGRDSASCGTAAARNWHSNDAGGETAAAVAAGHAGRSGNGIRWSRNRVRRRLCHRSSSGSSLRSNGSDHRMGQQQSYSHFGGSGGVDLACGHCLLSAGTPLFVDRSVPRFARGIVHAQS